jgi:hypothetical protein
MGDLTQDKEVPGEHSTVDCGGATLVPRPSGQDGDSFHTDVSIWVEEFPGAVTVCDLNGVIVAMNAKSCETFQKYGGKALIGSNLLDCHPEPAQTKVRELLSSGRTNVYTIEKNGVKKLIYQSPWYVKGRRCGMVELALEIPATMPHFVRG